MEIEENEKLENIAYFSNEIIQVGVFKNYPKKKVLTEKNNLKYVEFLFLDELNESIIYKSKNDLDSGSFLLIKNNKVIFDYCGVKNKIYSPKSIVHKEIVEFFIDEEFDIKLEKFIFENIKRNFKNSVKQFSFLYSHFYEYLEKDLK